MQQQIEAGKVDPYCVALLVAQPEAVAQIIGWKAALSSLPVV